MSAVQRLAEKIKSTYNKIDVLLNNAGAYFADFGTTEEGFENTFALNHLSYFQLTDLLLDAIKATPNSRIVNVASNAHLGTNLNFDNLQGFDGYKGWPAYCKSKLCNIMFTYELARRLQGCGTTANCLHPGFVKTNFGNNNKTKRAHESIRCENGWSHQCKKRSQNKHIFSFFWRSGKC